MNISQWCLRISIADLVLVLIFHLLLSAGKLPLLTTNQVRATSIADLNVFGWILFAVLLLVLVASLIGMVATAKNDKHY